MKPQIVELGIMMIVYAVPRALCPRSVILIPKDIQADFSGVGGGPYI